MNEGRMLREGKIGVIATDTIYGIVAAAAHEAAVNRVYSLKGRTESKPCIILIASVLDLVKFNILLTEKRHELLSRYWPGPVSVVLSCSNSVPQYLHRGTHTLAFRVPNNTKLRHFLRESGPLIAPSANPEGLPPATTVEEAKKYFNDTVDFYIDDGVRDGKPSTIIALDENDSITIIRGELAICGPVRDPHMK